jgi:type I restriction enzyme R subunit
MLRDVIAKAREGRISDAEKLQLVLKIEEQVKHRSGDSLPSRLEERDPVAKAYYGFAYQFLKDFEKDTFNSKEVSADVAIKIDEIVLDKRIRDWVDNQDVKNKMLNEIEDYLFDVKARYGLELPLDAIDDIMAESMKVAERRRAL